MAFVRARWLRFSQVVIPGALSLLLYVACSNSSGDIQIEKGPGVNPWNHLRLKNDPAEFQFALLADVTGREREGVLSEAVQKLNLLQPEFVVSIGDLIEGHTNDPAQLNRDWDRFFELVSPLEVPLFYVPGNHDYWYPTQQSADGKRLVYDMASVYKQRVGRSYYHFIYRGVLFLILNNSMGDPAEFEAQKQYVTKTLKENAKVRWTFTFFHYPFWPATEEEAKDLSHPDALLATPIWVHVAPLLRDRPYTAFAGNSHQYVAYERDGRDLINIATTAGMSRMRGPQYGEFDHLVWITMTDKGPKIANLMLDGIYDKYVRTERSKALTTMLLGEAPIRSEPLLLRNAVFKDAVIKVSLQNPADIPLHLYGSARPHESLISEPLNFSVDVPAKGKKTIELKLRADGGAPASRLEPLVVDWTGRYALDGNDPDVEVSGKHRVIIDSPAVEPAYPRTVLLERFRAPQLDRAWTPLGPGGRFDAQGRYVLTDDPAAKDVEAHVYKYTDGRGIYTLTPLWHLPAAGLYRDIPPGSFEAKLSLSDLKWAGEEPTFSWEFWDQPDLAYNYGPSYLRAVRLQAFRRAGKYIVAVRTFKKPGVADKRTALPGGQFAATDVGELELRTAPSALNLRALWRESTQRWHFFVGVDGAEATTPLPGSGFAQGIDASPEGKRMLIYLNQAKDGEGSGSSVVLAGYRLSH